MSNDRSINDTTKCGKLRKARSSKGTNNETSQLQMQNASYYSGTYYGHCIMVHWCLNCPVPQWTGL